MENNVIELLGKGGITIYTLVFCSILMVAIVSERFYYLRKMSSDSARLTGRIASFLKDGKVAESIEFLKGQSGILPAVLTAGLLRYDRDKEEIETALVNSIQEHVPKMERFIGSLGTIAVIAPFLGLLGTILGMINSFSQIALKGTSGPSVIATGIYEALYATAAGLVVAIPAVIFYNYFMSRVRKTVSGMEVSANKIVEMIQVSRRKEKFPEDLLFDSEKSGQE